TAVSLKDKSLLGHFYLQLSISYYNKKEYQLAIENSQKSFQYFSDIQDSNDKILALFALADSYKGTKEIDKALEISAQIRNLMQDDTDDLIKLSYYKLLAEVFYQMGDLR